MSDDANDCYFTQIHLDAPSDFEKKFVTKKTGQVEPFLS